MMEGNNRKVKARAILVFGMPCSGKTTFCENFARQFKAPFYDLNSLANDYKFSQKQLVCLIDQLAKTKQTLIIEGGLETAAKRLDMRNRLRKAGYEPTLVWIQTDVATIKSRLKTRLKTVGKAKFEYDMATKKLEAPTEAENPVVLSGKHTYMTQAKHVLARLAQ